MRDSMEAVLNQASPRGTARRCEIRVNVSLLGTLSAASRPPACVQVSDLSRGGACCRAANPPPIGSEVELKLEGLAARAIVCWSSGGVMGLRFLEPLRASDILIQSSRSRCAASPERVRHLAAFARPARRTD